MKATLNHLTKVVTTTLISGSLLWATGCSSGGDSDDGTPAPAAQGVASTGTAVTGENSTQNPTGTGSTTTDDSTVESSPASAAASHVDCEASWKAYVAANPAGLTLAYKTTTETRDGAGALINSSVSNSESKILAADDTHVVTLSTSFIEGLSNPIENESELTRTQFIEGCQTVGGIQVGTASVTILEQGTQTITVAAGTFPTNYSKSSVTSSQLAGESIISSWVLTDGSNIMVKSEVSVSSTVAGFTFQNHIVTELTKIVRP